MKELGQSERVDGLFLLIHTSLDAGFVAIVRGKQIIAFLTNEQPREHGSFLHDAIEKLFDQLNIGLNQIEAIGVTGGPGSYTGIRVGLSAAKGIGYALNKPLVVINNLEVMAHSVIRELKNKEAVYVPVIYARPGEFYAGFYDSDLNEVKPNQVINLKEWLENVSEDDNVISFGIGIEKIQPYENNHLYVKKDGLISIEQLNEVFSLMYKKGEANRAQTASPLYIKEAYVTQPKTTLVDI